MDKRRNTQPNRDDKRYAIAETMRAAKEISELPKSVEWKTDGEYTMQIVERVYEVCERAGLMPTINLLASAIGVPKDVVDDVRNGYIGANPDVVSAITLYYQVCENTMVQSALDGNVNNIAGIFAQKSMYGYKEEPREIKITHNKLLGERKDPKAIAERYASAVIDAKPEDVSDIDW